MAAFPMGIKSNNQMRTILGVTLYRFGLIKLEFEKAFNQRQMDRFLQALEEGTRTRNMGGGRKPKLLTIEDKLCFCLLYLKGYPKFEDLANRFGMSLSTTHDNLYYLLPFLQQALHNLGVMPIRDFTDVDTIRAYLKKKDLTL